MQKMTDSNDDDNNDFFDRLRKQNSTTVKATDYGAESEEDRESDISPDQESTNLQQSEDGEHSGMLPEARRALVSLLRQGVILASQKARLFETICRYQSEVRNHLSDVYLKLVLDEKSGVAFVASVKSDDEDWEDEEVVSLISRRSLLLFDTLVLLVLRKHYQEREASGEQKVVIDIERIEANLVPFLPLTNSSKADRRKLEACLSRMHERKIISSIRGSKDRLEITPIIRYVVNAEFLERMLKEYQCLAQVQSQEQKLETNLNNAVDEQ